MYAFSAFAVSLVFLLPAPVAAYLDPGTGSYITQVLVASLLGGLYALKLSWTRVKLYFSKAGKTTKEEKSDTHD
jgi:hypothetical protein